MIEIAIKVCGDHWLNPQEVESQLRQIPRGQRVVVNMNTEGASLQALGIDRLLDQYLDVDQIFLRAWSNNVEQVAYRRLDTHLYSHFFWLAQRYWNAEVSPNNHQHRFACLIGRATWPRVRMLWDLQRYLGDGCLVSLMGRGYLPDDQGRNLDVRGQWVDDAFDLQSDLGSLTSLDGHRVKDQYDPLCNTNLSLLTHYHRFDIEIVAESYCRGPAFFPTEKTIRPLLFRKPLLVYGPRHYLQQLRAQGFQTWSDWWDEGYDDLEGPERWQAMLRQIKILGCCDHFDVLYDDYQSVLEHNRSRALEIGYKHQPQ